MAYLKKLLLFKLLVTLPLIRQAIREVLPREICKGDWWASGSGYEGRY